MTALYQIDPNRSRFSVQVFATGMLSFFGHSPTFAVRDYSGQVRLEQDENPHLTLNLTVKADSLEVLDRLSPADRRDIEGRLRREVLDTSTHPEITYQADDIQAIPSAPNHYRLRILGRLSLRGVTRPQPVEADLRLFDDGLQMLGGCTLRLSDHHIRPVTALGGAIKLRDDLSLSFDLAAPREGP